MKIKIIILFIFISLLLLGCFYIYQNQGAFRKSPNLNQKADQIISIESWQNKYNDLLKEIVFSVEEKSGSQTLVKYSLLNNHEGFKELIEELPKISFANGSNQKEELAAWLNIYNFLILKVVYENPHIKKLSDLDEKIKKVWHLPVGVVNGTFVTLDQIEHHIIRKNFNEPRIHFALNCGAMSCPNLRNEAYHARKIDLQLNEQLQGFILHSGKGMFVDYDQKIIKLSQIFKWFAEDFNSSPLAWLKQEGLISEEEKNFKLEYLPYHWELNQ